MYYSQKSMYMASLILVLGLAAGVANADITSGLVGYYRLDEGAGDIAHDMSGEGHDGTLHNGATWITPGYQGDGVNFDGTANTRIELGTWNPAEETEQLSLALWIRWAGGGGTYQGLVGKRNDWPATTMFQFQVRPENGGTFRLETGTYQVVSPNGTLTPFVQTWAHVATTFDGTTCRLYLNGEEIASGDFAFTTAGEASNMGIGCVTGGGAGHSGNGEVFLGDIDEVRIYNRALSEAEIPATMEGEMGLHATGPEPEDGETDVLRDAVLSWGSGDYAVTHDVYFGTVFDDVNAADRANPMDVLLSQNQAATTFDPPGVFDFGQTYYWRIDEVNGAPDFTIFRGKVWSFTAEPLGYPIANIIATSNTISDPASDPKRTVDGSGLNAADQHSTSATDMWFGIPVGADPVYIQYEFDRVYKMHEMRVWNYNVLFELALGFGLKDVTVEYSTDGADWTLLDDLEFAQATARSTYEANTVVDFGGQAAKYVRLTVNSGWGLIGQFGLSEVRFLYIPTLASDPVPADAGTSEGLDVVLAWRAGREAGQHEVILSTDEATVANGSAVIGTTSEPRFDLAGQGIRYGTTYYWAINEVNDTGPSAYLSPVWSFTTPEFAVVDDFESYDDEKNRIYETWVDGYGVNDNGSQVGHLEAPFAERTIVNSGKQSMPITYDNSLSPFYSEAESADFTLPSDWSKGEPDVLSLYFRGRPAAFQENADGTITVSGGGADIWGFSDEFRYVFKRLSGDGSIAAKVESLIPIHGWTKVGVMIRETTGPGARHTSTLVTPSNGISFHRRLIAADPTAKTDAQGVTTPYWVKITRSGNTFTSERSADGVTWEPMTADPAASSEQITMSTDVLIGLAVTSHMSGVLTVGEFSNVSTSPNVTGPWQVADVGVEQPSNAADRLYLAVEDGAGRMEEVVHPDLAATQTASWTKWEIPLSEFSSLDLSNVKRMYLGIGDRNNPQVGGTGLMYFDDVRVGRAFKSIGLFAYYALEDNTNDSSGNGYDGVAVGNPIYVTGPAGYGMAMEFDGAGGQYVDLGNLNPSRTGQFSASLWAKWNGLSGFWQGLMGKRNSWAAADMVWELEIHVDNGALYVHRHSGETVSMDPLVEGEWTHIAATYDGNTARLYRNGVLTASGPFTLGPKTDAALVFGAVEANGGNPFNGALDEVRIYDTVLAEQEVLVLAGQ